MDDFQDRNGSSGLKVRVNGYERHVETSSTVGDGFSQEIELKAHWTLLLLSCPA